MGADGRMVLEREGPSSGPASESKEARRSFGTPDILGFVLLGGVLLILALYAGRTQRRIAHGTHHPDFQVFYEAARVASQGRDIYGEGALQAPYPYVYPPLLATLLRPWASMGFRNAALLWNVLQLLLVLVGFWALWALGYRLGGRTSVLLAGAALAAGGWSLAENIVWGQVNLLVLAVILGALLAYLDGRFFRFGLLVALGFCVKLVPGVLGLLAFGLSRRRAGRLFAGMAVGLLAFGLLVPGMLDGFGWTIHATGRFVSVVRRGLTMGRRGLPWGNNCANGSLLFALHHLVGVCAPAAQQVSPRLVTFVYDALRGIVAAGTLAGAWFWAGRPDRTAFGLFVAQILAAALLLNPVTWPHHLVFLVPSLGALAALAVPKPPRQMPLGPAVAAVALAGLLSLSHELEDLRRGSFALGLLGLWGLLTAVLAVHRARSPGRAEAPGEPDDMGS